MALGVVGILAGPIGLLGRFSVWFCSSPLKLLPVCSPEELICFLGFGCEKSSTSYENNCFFVVS